MLYLTGANGWLGLNIVSHIKDGRAMSLGLKENSARCFILKGTDITKLERLVDITQIFEGDIKTGDGLERFFMDGTDGILIHAVGVIHPRNIKDFYEINVEGTRNVIDAAVKAGLRRAVIISSNSPFGCNPHNDHQFDEFSPYAPYMNYGRSKMEMELLVKEYQLRGDIEIVIVRAPWFYGPHQPDRQRLFFTMIRDGSAPVVGSGKNLRSMVFMQNLVDGVFLCASVDRAKNQAYWIADEYPYSMNEIINTVERLLEKDFNQSCRHTRMKLPGMVSEIAMAVDCGLQKLGVYHQKTHVLSEMNKTIACSIQKAKIELGYNPEVALEEGMRLSLSELFNQKIK